MAVRRLSPLLLLPLAAPAWAADQDAQLWTVISASGSVRGAWLANVDTVVRASHDQQAVSSAEGTIMLGNKVSKHVAVWAGLGLSHLNLANGGAATLHRGRQQLTATLGKIGQATLTTRTMLEERWWLHRRGAGVRLRQQVRLTQPIGHGKTAVFISAEPILNLNSTDWGQNGGLNRLRSSIGLSFALTPHLRGDFGYLNDYDARPNRVDRDIHAALLNFAFSF